MTLKQLKYLVGIVDSGLNITSAAERLYTSQPGISKQLKQLEAELGVQLFTRKGKSLAAITPAGRDVIARARKILRDALHQRHLSLRISLEVLPRRDVRRVRPVEAEGQEERPAPVARC